MWLLLLIKHVHKPTAALIKSGDSECVYPILLPFKLKDIHRFATRTQAGGGKARSGLGFTPAQLSINAAGSTFSQYDLHANAPW